MEHILHNAPEVLLLLFLIITFLQSGLDKIMDWKGNVSWLKGHFAQTPFKNTVPFLLSVILLMEIIAGLLCVVGAYEIIVSGASDLAFYGALVASVSLLMLLLGQRIAKDYEGAKTIVIYFIPTVFLLFLLQN
ncbi:DoxX family protein [Spongiimicrobium sp. 3-5]|uniref:DoxX family protein n=1 Tax=Spongiimicrobium sp. 3-5 TaxID=3332596 RepID=UPI00397EBAD0